MKINAETTLKTVREFFTKTQTSLNGLAAIDALPAPLRTTLQAILADVNQSLEKLPVVEQVQGANDAAWALNYLADALARTQQLTESVMSALEGMRKDWAASLNAAVETALNAKVTAGELVPKAQLDDLVAVARNAAATEALARAKALQSRRDAVVAAGLPVLADEALGAGDDAAFTARVEAAKGRMTQLSARQISLQSMPGLVTELAWAREEEFTQRLGLIDQVQAVAKQSKPAPVGDPLLGGTGGESRKSTGVVLI